MWANAATDASRWIRNSPSASPTRAARITSRSIEPLGSVEAAIFLNRTVDALNHARLRDDDATGSERQRVTTFALAVLRIDVDDRLAEARLRQSERHEPERLHFSLLPEMVGIEMACDPDPVIGES